jgi:hypothetical protein
METSTPVITDSPSPGLETGSRNEVSGREKGATSGEGPDWLPSTINDVWRMHTTGEGVSEIAEALGLWRSDVEEILAREMAATTAPTSGEDVRPVTETPCFTCGIIIGREAYAWHTGGGRVVGPYHLRCVPESEKAKGFVLPTNGAGRRGSFAHPTDAAREVTNSFRRDPETGRSQWLDRSQGLVNAVAQLAEARAELAEARAVILDYQQDVDRYGFLYERARSVTFNDDDSVTLTYRDGASVGLAGGDTLDDAVDNARKQAGEV